MNMNPYGHESYEVSSEHLRLALAFLAKHRLPPSPLNYRIGYDCATGSNEQLKKVFANRIQEPDSNTPDALWELYKEFFVQDDAALNKLRENFRQMITLMQNEFASTDTDLSNYSSTLERFSGLLEGTQAPDALAQEIKNVLSETKAVDSAQNRLKNRLDETHRELETLRQELSTVRKESLSDALTGVANRKAFDLEIDSEIQAANEQHLPLCLLLADIDHFKRFNDTHGHLIGDKVLRFVATTIKRTVKGKDLVARYGGEEFAIILPQTSLEGGQIVAEQVRSAVSKRNLVNKDNAASYGRVTISIGIAEYAGESNPAELIARADQALYLAKDQGRDRVALAA